MALPASFSNNTSPTGVQLDNCLLALGAMAVQLCTATGTNTITLTPNANQPTVSAYVSQQFFAFTAVNSSSGPVTLQVLALAALPLYLPGGAQADNGSITNGTPYLIQYLASLNSGSGGFQILSAVPAINTAPAALASFRGLTVKNNSSTPNTKVDIAASLAVLTTTGGTPKLISAFTGTCDLTTTGANGMDTGARPTSGWVYLYAINNGSTNATLGTLTSPTAGLPSPFPGGYSNYGFVGAMYCDGSQNLRRSTQVGRFFSYTLSPATNTAVTPNIANGLANTYSATSPVLGNVSVTSVVPLTAGVISLALYNTYNGGANNSVLVAPNTGWGGTNTGSNGAAGTGIYELNSSSTTTGEASFPLESTNIAWASSGAGGAVSCYGFTDYYVNA